MTNEPNVDTKSKDGENSGKEIFSRNSSLIPTKLNRCGSAQSFERHGLGFLTECISCGKFIQGSDTQPKGKPIHFCTTCLVKNTDNSPSISPIISQADPPIGPYERPYTSPYERHYIDLMFQSPFFDNVTGRFNIPTENKSRSIYPHSDIISQPKLQD